MTDPIATAAPSDVAPFEPATDAATTTPAFVVTSEGELLGEDSPENRELVRRIEACVNACEGLSTADLEGGIVHQMLKVVTELTPLLAAPPAPMLKKAS